MAREDGVQESVAATLQGWLNVSEKMSGMLCRNGLVLEEMESWERGEEVGFSRSDFGDNNSTVVVCDD